MRGTPAGGAAAAVVVTGAGGFAGRWLCRELHAAGQPVIAWVHRPPAAPLPGLSYRVLDLRDAPGVRRALAADAPAAVYHLAALSHPADCAADPAAAHAVNVGGTEALLAGLPPGARLLLASTCLVYGPPRELPLREDHPLAPTSVYARSKALAEQAVRRAAEAGVHAVIARAFHHCGPGQDPRYAVAGWAALLAARRLALADGLPPPALVVGDLSLRRDYTDVRDIVAGYRVVLERAAPGAVVQLCSGEAPTLGTLLAWLAGGEAPPVVVDPARLRPDDPPELRGCPARAEALGWRRRHPLRQALPALVDAATPSGRP